MAQARSKYVKNGEEGVYHCISRCVRRAYLYGYDAVTGRDFSHRKQWVLDRLQHLAAIFAIDVCAFAIMANHMHNILRTRPDIAASWSDLEVATRWLTLCPPTWRKKRQPKPPLQAQIQALADNPALIAELRSRLCNISWFMGQLNEFIARAANKEDKVKGRFWEGRFSCLVLLDEAAIAVCMAYVDLNPVRAGIAATPEDSDFTSIQQRIRAWQQERMTEASVSSESESPVDSDNSKEVECSRETQTPASAIERASGNAINYAAWLCPITSDGQRRGILQMTEAEYVTLVDRTGRIIRTDKRGAIDPNLAPILSRIGVRPETWSDTVSEFGRKFHIAAGLLSNIRCFAERIGSRWLQGMTQAKTAFAASQ